MLGVTLAAGATLTIDYGCQAAKGPGATATTGVGAATWTTTEKSTSGGAETRPGEVAGHHGDPDPGHAGRAVGLARLTECDRCQLHAQSDAKSSTVTIRLAKDGSFVKAVEGDTTGI